MAELQLFCIPWRSSFRGKDGYGPSGRMSSGIYLLPGNALAWLSGVICCGICCWICCGISFSSGKIVWKKWIYVDVSANWGIIPPEVAILEMVPMMISQRMDASWEKQLWENELRPANGNGGISNSGSPKKRLQFGSDHFMLNLASFGHSMLGFRGVWSRYHRCPQKPSTCLCLSRGRSRTFLLATALPRRVVISGLAKWQAFNILRGGL